MMTFHIGLVPFVTILSETGTACISKLMHKL